MKARIRWISIEAVKIAVVLSLLLWIQSDVVDTKYEVFQKTDALTQQSGVHASRIYELQTDQQDSGQALANAVVSVNDFREDLVAQSETVATTRAALLRAIDDRAGELRNLIESGILRVEGTSHTAYQEARATVEKFENLAGQIQRHPFEMKERMIYPVVQLRGNGTVGSGVAIWSRSINDGDAVTYVLTAYHVVLEVLGAPGSTEVTDLRFMDPKTDRLQDATHTGNLLCFDEQADIALLSVVMDEPWPYVARLASLERVAGLTIFDQVYAVGCPLGNKPMPTPGEISSQQKIVNDHNFWMVNAPTFFGNSGGGVFLNDSAELIGISSMIYTYGKSQPMVVPHMGLFVPLNSVAEWLVENSYGHLVEPGPKMAQEPVAEPKTASAPSPDSDG